MTLEEIKTRLKCRLGRLVRFAAKQNKERFIYGVIQRGSEPVRCKARLDTKTNRVQFVLWKAGEQGHEEDYWHNMGCGWENHFKPNVRGSC